MPSNDFIYSYCSVFSRGKFAAGSQSNSNSNSNQIVCISFTCSRTMRSIYLFRGTQKFMQNHTISHYILRRFSFILHSFFFFGCAQFSACTHRAAALPPPKMYSNYYVKTTWKYASESEKIFEIYTWFLWKMRSGTSERWRWKGLKKKKNCDKEKVLAVYQHSNQTRTQSICFTMVLYSIACKQCRLSAPVFSADFLHGYGYGGKRCVVGDCWSQRIN